MTTALGPAQVLRTSFACTGCQQGGTHVDALLGLQGFLTRQAERLVCLIGGQLPFAPASRMLAECCGWTLSDETMRRTCQAQAPRTEEFTATPTACQAFVGAPGEVEFQLDAAKVSTTDGWRDMKIGNFVRRRCGDKATPAEWDDRVLPPPSARFGFAAIESIELLAPRIGIWASRLGVIDPTTVTTLGDGAAWIWNAAGEQLPGSGGVLDIDHAAEPIAAAGKKLFGEGTAAAANWLETGRGLLLSDDWFGLCDHIGITLTSTPELAGHAALGELTSYFAAHTSRTSYCHRLYTGRSIGSGAVEAAAKN